jgi:hypothetical protein
MRKTIYSILTLGFIIGSIATSCSTEDRNNGLANNTENQSVLSKSDVINATLAKQLQYKKFYLQKAGNVMRELEISTDDLVQLSLQSEAKGQQEKTFLLKDLVTMVRSRKQSISSDLSKSLDELDNAFKGIDGRNYNISIYIPFAEKLESSRKSVSNRTETASTDIFIFEEEDNSQQQYFEGFILNEDGNYVSYDQLINEQMAEEYAEQGRNVAVIGIQDVVVVNPPTDPSTAVNKSFRMGNMTVRDHKESWVAGASEITIQMYKQEKGTLQKINLINSSTFGASANNFAQIKRRDIKNQNQIYVGAMLAGMIDTNTSVFPNSRFPYVIYEADNWPVTERKVPFTLPNGQFVEINFGSSDGEYYNSKANNMQIATVIDNSTIKFYPFLQ